MSSLKYLISAAVHLSRKGYSRLSELRNKRPYRVGKNYSTVIDYVGRRLGTRPTFPVEPISDLTVLSDYFIDTKDQVFFSHTNEGKRSFERIRGEPEEPFRKISYENNRETPDSEPSLLI